MDVLVINSGSSSIKYQLFDMTDRSVLASGLLERIAEADGVATHRVRGPDGVLQERVDRETIPDHDEGFRRIVAALDAAGHGGELAAIGHRVVHGGEVFVAPTQVDAEVIARIREQIPLAPLHNPANLRGIEVAYVLRPDLPQVAVFDTAFHRFMPPRAYRYAIPTRLYTESHIRRYGFHGTSHEYVARRAAEHLGIPFEEVNLITLHLGNGASATAVERGRSVDTSMGLSPLEGLVMGTRSGDLDPTVVFHLTRHGGMDVGEVETLLNRASGLKGLAGANDMREVERLAAAGDEAARLALEVYCYRIRKYVGAYLAVLGRVDALVFTAGVGENSPTVRAGSVEGLQRLGFRLAPERNDARSAGRVLQVHADDSAVAILVVPTNEELAIAEQTLACIGAT